MDQDKEIEFEHKIIHHNHILWKEMFLECCDNENSELIITRLSDPRQCECGRLLYGSMFFRLYANVPGVAELESEHQRLHQMAKDILMKTGTTKKREDVIESSERFMELLDSVYDILNQKAIIRRTLHPDKLPAIESP